MTRPKTKGFQKPIDDGQRREVGMPIITYMSDGAVCSCGKPFKPARTKVLEDRIDDHLNKKHGGRGLRI